MSVIENHVVCALVVFLKSCLFVFYFISFKRQHNNSFFNN